jgi:alanyl aminopeptidase
METAFSVGVQEIGKPFFDRLLEQGLASEDPAFRNAAFGGLARVEDPSLAAKLHEAILAGEFRGMEPLRITSRQMARKATADLTFQWMKANNVALFELIPPARRGTIVPTFGNYFCSADKANEWETFVAAHAETLPGYERDLAQATESIRLCASLKSARAADLLAALQGVP